MPDRGFNNDCHGNQFAPYALGAEAVARMPRERACKCGSALAHAILTDRALVPETTRKKLGPIVAKYFV